MVWKETYKNYWKSSWNITSWLLFIAYILYFVIRVGNPTKEMIPMKGQTDWGMAMWTFFNTFILLIAAIEWMYYAMVEETFGNMVQAIIEVFKKIQMFILFLAFWMLMFSFFYNIAGNNILRSKENVGININVLYFLRIVRNTIGDITTPSYEPWLEYSKVNEGRITWLSTLMISYIWLLWIINVFFMFVILMNLFIAIVSIAFEEVLEITIQIKYKQRI
jgi:hypothetical protein